MRRYIWTATVLILVGYAALVALFGFAGVVALSIQFLRVAVTIAALVLWTPALKELFKEVPAPRRDYLLAGIWFTLLSGACFATWNEIGKLFDLDTNVFTSPVSGAFSLFLIASGIYFLIAPGRTSGRMNKNIAILIGVLYSIGLVFIAPLFR